MRAKQVVYVYDGDAKSNEVIRDIDGEVAVPTQGEIVERKGKSWIVAAIHTQTAISGDSLPIVKVFLSSAEI